MITAEGYSKDPNLVPEAVVVTFGREMMDEQGGPLQFLRFFESWMDGGEGNYWLHKCKNRPQADIIHVYVIVMNRLYCRCYFGGYEKGKMVGSTADGRNKEFDWPRLILSGPIEKPRFKRTLKGFQGFRYATSLF